MSRRVSFCLWIVTSLLVILAATAIAAEVTRPGTNAAPLTATPATSPVVRHTPTAEERALLAVQEEGRTQVQALVEGMKGLPDGPALRALQHKVEDVKRDSRVAFLRVKADFARRRGDLAAAHEAEDLIDAMLHPRAATHATVARPAPDKAQGGRP